MISFLHLLLLMKRKKVTRIVTTASAVGPGWWTAAFSVGSSPFTGCSPEPELREGKGRINVVFIRTAALPFIHSLPINQYGARLDRVPYMTENKSCRCRRHMGVLLRGTLLLWLFEGCRGLKNWSIAIGLAHWIQHFWMYFGACVCCQTPAPE